MKVLILLRNDFIGGVAFNAGEICGWPDHVADKLLLDRPGGAYARLYSDGKPREVGGGIPGAKDYWDNVQLAEHKAELEKNGKWKPAPPVVVLDPDARRAARERARNEMNQI
jgi:hypothetical protein